MENTARKARIQEMSDYIKNTPEDKQFKSFPIVFILELSLLG